MEPHARLHPHPRECVAWAQLAARWAFMAHPELRDPTAPYGSCSGCEKPDGAISTHYEGTYQHPLPGNDLGKQKRN
jgi:hypothetical protein